MNKKQLTEQMVAAEFNLYIMGETQKNWKEIYNTYKKTYGDKFTVTDEIMAPYDLALASIAENIQVVNNVFPKEQAERIKKWILKLVDTEDYGEYSLGEIKKYEDMFIKSVDDNARQSGSFNGINPLAIITTCLLNQWLGDSFRDFDVVVNGKKTGVVDPILMDLTNHILMTYIYDWKKIKENFDLVEGDIPFDENPTGLKDYTPEQKEKKPDGTIQYYDENGNLKEKWFPPDQLKELLEKGNAKKAYKILIKGPWEGIKEDWWELTDDVIKKFVDENDFAYAIAHYEKGELKYTFISKILWEKQEEMEEILMNPNLSQEQKIKEVRKLASKNQIS